MRFGIAIKGIAIKFRTWRWRLSLRLSRRYSLQNRVAGRRKAARHPER